MLEFELKHGYKPITAFMGLAFKPDIDDLRESPAKYIAQKVMQSDQNNFLVVEPNIREHSVFKLTNYFEAYQKADIIVFLVAHKEFKTLTYNEEKVILDFAGIFKRN
jgi:UDP-N-acetyl-D-mannosaminuronic acid dehydrogenase